MTRLADIRSRRTGTIDTVVLDTVVIGAGHSGLAASYMLRERGVRHVVLERGDVANAWRERCWSSLRLLTPNRHMRLPGLTYEGGDPDGFMRVPELISLLEAYAVDAPVVRRAEVTSVRADGDNWRVASTAGEWRARTVVIASGACARASVPAIASKVPAGVTQLTPLAYRSPAEIERGGVLVVGASATGLQFADELARAGHEVTLAVGEHVRMPRYYRGRDIVDWMIRAGISDERFDEIDDVNRGRNLPSPQLVGDRQRLILDLNSLTGAGVTITGRLMGIRDGTAQFSGTLRNVCALADLKMHRLLQSLDEIVGDDSSAPPPERFAVTRVPAKPVLGLKLDGNIRTIIWATGFRPDFSWLDAPVFDRKGRLEHDGGVLATPGLYVLGLPLLRRRKSSFIYGAEDDARDITDHLTRYLAGLDAARAGSENNGIHPDGTCAGSIRRSA